MGIKNKRTAFKHLVEEHSRPLYKYAYWLCHDHSIAEELVQETYLRAWKYFYTLKDFSVAKSWLITILRRENARRFEKKRVTEVHIPVENLDSQVQDFENDIDDMALRQALKKIPKDYREPLILQVMFGYKSNEIAKLLAIKPGAVMTRLFRAREMLKNANDSDDKILDSQEVKLNKPKNS